MQTDLTETITYLHVRMVKIEIFTKILQIVRGEYLKMIFPVSMDDGGYHNYSPIITM